MPMELILFYVLGGGAVAFSAAMLLPVVGRNPIHSALSLIGSFFCLAGLYALLSAHLLAALQIIVYAGAVMVLFTFVIMLLNLAPDEIQPPRLSMLKVLAAGMGLFIFGRLLSAVAVATAGAQAVDLGSGAYDGYGTIRVVGRMLYTSFLVPFELISVLLLVAAVGAVVLAKKTLTYVNAPVPPPARLTRLADQGDAAGGDGHDAHGDHGHH